MADISPGARGPIPCMLDDQRLKDGLLPAFRSEQGFDPFRALISSREAAARSFLMARLAAMGQNTTPSPWQPPETDMALRLAPGPATALAQAAEDTFGRSKTIGGLNPERYALAVPPQMLPVLAHPSPIGEPAPSLATGRPALPPILWHVAGVTMAVDTAGLGLESRRALVRGLASGSWQTGAEATRVLQLSGHGAAVRISAQQLLSLARDGAPRGLSAKTYRAEVQGHTLLLKWRDWQRLLAPAASPSGAASPSAYRGSIDGRPLTCRMDTLRALLELPGAPTDGPRSMRLDGVLFDGPVSVLRALLGQMGGSPPDEPARFGSPDADEMIMIES